ncbi:Error-prone repair protein ImuA [Mucilaginibacter conchicola]|uniref:Error-prone repair protein ImuA n=1 Tax=Mucilaginibacter conchicola TaxID=2303333 RepID=A0A372NN49_9SPHI|nr:Error-prone repair protein ImuA [Mucilaginibacter conchicola]RFZ90070.1 Error-prone repair protein ImuA [Mucilaginibacter conchicola]
MLATKEDIISKLRQDMIRWEGFRPPVPGTSGDLGLGVLAKSFPNGVFPTGAVHEFISSSPEDTAACGGFISGIVHQLLSNGGACLWISYTRRIYPPALKLFGVDPDQVIFVDVPAQKDVLWVTEEALKCEGVAAVICEIKELSFMESRRLQLAVEKSRVTGFLLRKDVKKINTTACITRWQVRPVRSKLREGMPGVGQPRWQVELQKIRNGKPGSWTVEWKKLSFRTIETLPVLTECRRYA